MTTDYNPIAEQYQRSKQQPWRQFIECHTLLKLIGDLRDVTALDVACGEGFYTRLLRHGGATAVTGIDLSPGMIDLARGQETRQPLGIDYIVGDARDLQQAKYDLVVAAYLLNYASTDAELLAMCAGVARSLKPGGRFVTVNSSPSLHFPSAPSYRKYGFETSTVGAWQEGTPIKWTFHLEDGPFDIENYYLNVATHETALQKAGFRSVQWHSPQLFDEGRKAFEPTFWDTFLTTPPITFIECVK